MSNSTRRWPKRTLHVSHTSRAIFFFQLQGCSLDLSFVCSCPHVLIILFFHPIAQSSPPTPSMSPTHTVTAKSVGIAKTPSSAEMDDDDDNDICPVCEGECTCAKLESSYQPKLPSLKIKLTVPATLRKTLSTSHGSAHLMMSDVEIDGGRTPTIPIAGPSQPKRRGRPPKIKSLLPGSVGPSHSTTQSTKPRARVTPAGRPTIKKNAAAIKKRKRARSSSAESSSSLSSLSASDPQNTASSHYPTFISASVIDSGPSSDSSASSDEEGQPADYSLDEATDSSIEAEEEQFILQNEQRMWKGKGKGRKGRKEEESKNSNKLRREKRRKEMLLSGKEREKRDHHHHNHDHFPFDANASDGASNDWVIRPRKSSFGGGAPDIPMRDLNGNSSTASSSLSSSVEASDDETAAEADEEPDDGDSKADDDEGTQEGKPRRYKRFATTWSMYTSSDEESSFDADMFFANLSDSSDDENSSCDEQCEMEGEDGDQSDLDGDSTMMSPPVHPMVLSGADALAATSFEVTEHWDGGIGFTNGEELGSSLFGNGFGFEGLGLGTPFQLNDQPRIREDGYFDVPVPSTDTAETSRSRSRSPDGYSSSNGGDTTDEDLIDSTSNLPNERAMNMFESPFKLPLHLESLHGVNPMNTVSPVRRGRKAFKAHALSPAPADILAGTTKEPWGRQYEDVDMDADEDVVMSGEALTPPSSGSHSRTRSIGGLPIAREFLLKDEATSLVIGSETKSIPSPYHRAKRERRRRRQGLRTMFGSDLVRHLNPVRCTFTKRSITPAEAIFIRPSYCFLTVDHPSWFPFSFVVWGIG